MVSLSACKTWSALKEAGLVPVDLPRTDNTPIPGLMLLADDHHKKLMMVLGDGSAVNLLDVYHAAHDCVRNWHDGDKLNLPKFVGDFKRLTKLADAINGEKIS